LLNGRKKGSLLSRGLNSFNHEGVEEIYFDLNQNMNY